MCQYFKVGMSLTLCYVKIKYCILYTTCSLNDVVRGKGGGKNNNNRNTGHLEKEQCAWHFSYLFRVTVENIRHHSVTMGMWVCEFEWCFPPPPSSQIYGSSKTCSGTACAVALRVQEHFSQWMMCVCRSWTACRITIDASSVLSNV